MARKRKRGGGGGRDVRMCLEYSRGEEDMDEGSVDFQEDAGEIDITCPVEGMIMSLIRCFNSFFDDGSEKTCYDAARIGPVIGSLEI